MPVKPNATEIAAAKAVSADPEFGKHVLEAVINDNDELRAALVGAGLVEEVKNGG